MLRSLDTPAGVYISKEKENPAENSEDTSRALDYVLLPVDSIALSVGRDPSLSRSSGSRTASVADEKTEEALAANRRNTLIISGFATEAVVLHAATVAIAGGYRVLIPVDACGGLSERTEAAAFRQIEAFGGETTSVVTLATALVPDFSSDLGQRLVSILQQLLLT